MFSKVRLACYSLSHCIVDLCCFYLLMGYLAPAVDGATASLWFLLYDTVAFGLQPLLGIVLDRLSCSHKAARLFSALGVLLTVFAVLLRSYAIVSIALAALGNALFHIGGGVDTLRCGGGRMAPNGIFVATGAVGVSVGSLLGRGLAGSFCDCVILGLSVLSFALCVIALLRDRNTSRHTASCSHTYPTDTVSYDRAKRPPALAVVIIAFSVVVLRAFIGAALSLPVTLSGVLVILPGLCSALGKALGGVLADRFGARRVGALTVAMSAVCFALSGVFPPLSLAGLLLFNCSMPITLCVTASALERFHGLAFGLTTLGLLIGTLPCFFFSVKSVITPTVCIMMIIVSAVLLWACSGNEPNRSKYNER